MPKAATTNIHFILDKSGSMISVREATISGFNEYIQSLKGKFKFTLTLFDTEVLTGPTEGIESVDKLTPSTYQPGGNTALYDAVCLTLNKVKDSEGKNLVVIMTDGEENSSKEYTEKEMKKMVEELEAKENWSFVYLGANVDVYKNAQKFGIARGNAATFQPTAAGTIQVFTAMSSNTAAFARSASLNTKNYFSDEDKSRLKNG